jgi:hypothetical protein
VRPKCNFRLLHIVRGKQTYFLASYPTIMGNVSHVAACKSSSKNSQY